MPNTVQEIDITAEFKYFVGTLLSLKGFSVKIITPSIHISNIIKRAKQRKRRNQLLLLSKLVDCVQSVKYMRHVDTQPTFT